MINLALDALLLLEKIQRGVISEPKMLDILLLKRFFSVNNFRKNCNIVYWYVGVVGEGGQMTFDIYL